MNQKKMLDTNLYFKAVYDQMDNGGREALLHYCGKPLNFNPSGSCFNNFFMHFGG